MVLAAYLATLEANGASQYTPGSWHKTWHTRDSQWHDARDGSDMLSMSLSNIKSNKTSSLTSRDGRRYASVVYRNGRIHAGRSFTAKPHEHFDGYFVNGHRNGVGTLFIGSTVYHGIWDQGRLEGPVLTTLRNGSVWQSLFRQNYPFRGQTRWKYPPGSKHGIYFGDWYRGFPHGFGVFINGTLRYEGHWKNGKKEGWGVEHIGMEERYDGHFLDGRRQGSGILYVHRDSCENCMFKGNFRRGKRHGVFFEYSPGLFFGRKIEKAVYVNGKRKQSLPHSEL